MLRLIKKINRYLPENLRVFLLPFYRSLFPQLNNIIFIPYMNCNYSCPYCIWMKYVSDEKKAAYISYDKWIKVFESFPASSITITGGEPLLYKDIVPLIENFPKKHLISCLVTNLSLNIDKLKGIKRREFRIMSSFHPAMIKKEEFIANLLIARKYGFTNITINFVAYPEYLKAIPSLKKEFEKETGFYFRVDTYKDPGYRYNEEETELIRKYKRQRIIASDRTEGYSFSDFAPKICKAGRNYCLVSSDGSVYTCVEGYYYSCCQPYFDKFNKQDKFILGNVFDKNYTLSNKDRLCYSPCAELCDIELAGVRRKFK